MDFDWLEPPLRRARAEDAATLTRIVNAAGEDLPLAWWGMQAQDPWAFGEARQAAAAERGRFMALDEGEGCIAGLAGGLIDAAEAPEPETPDAFLPLKALEAEAVGSWYVNIVAALPGLRNRGHGSRLMKAAEGQATRAGAWGLSLIVNDGNEGAARLYRRLGFAEAARRPQVGLGDWTPRGRDWVLMTRRGPFG